MQSPLTIETDIDDITENFSFLEEWDDRYGYLIELGRALVPLDETARTDANKVQGCVSQVWLTHQLDADGRLHFKGASDAHIVSGLVAIALMIFSGKNPATIEQTDEQETFKAIGLAEHLTPQRANGLKSMVARIKAIAAQHKT